MTQAHEPMRRPGPGVWHGVAFVAGVLVFLASRFRHLVGMPESALWVVLPAGFALLIIGVTALRSRYAPGARGIGRAGLVTCLVGIVLLAIGHVGLLLHMNGPPALEDITGISFMPVMAGTLALTLGALLFGIDALRGDLLPRLHAAPAVTGVIGLAWLIFASDSRPVEGNPEAFLVMRTLFGLGWLVIALVFVTDTRGTRDTAAESRPARGDVGLRG